jgi:DNA (cytosine-5)-methyltransferase 1
MQGNFLTIKRASELLEVTPLTLRNWDRNGKLSARRHPMSNYRIYLREDIERLVHDITAGSAPIKAKKRKPLKRKLVVRSE